MRGSYMRFTIAKEATNCIECSHVIPVGGRAYSYYEKMEGYRSLRGINIPARAGVERGKGRCLSCGRRHNERISRIN